MALWLPSKAPPLDRGIHAKARLPRAANSRRWPIRWSRLRTERPSWVGSQVCDLLEAPRVTVPVNPTLSDTTTRQSCLGPFLESWTVACLLAQRECHWPGSPHVRTRQVPVQSLKIVDVLSPLDLHVHRTQHTRTLPPPLLLGGSVLYRRDLARYV